MMSEKLSDKIKVEPTNEVSDETGQFDARFILWRTFCAENGIPVETLPSELTDEMQEKWENEKKENLSTTDDGET
jgi:hypothetical protein